MAYGKLFDKKAGFISLEWLLYFVNCRRAGYDFDARWEDGLASRREKKIMDTLVRILSIDLKKTAGFGKGGEKNYAGVMHHMWQDQSRRT